MIPLTLFAQSALKQAVELTKQRKYAVAQGLLAGITEPSEPNQRIAFHRLKAAIASGLGQSVVAAHEMESALTLAPDDSDLLTAAAISELQAGLLTDALKHGQAAGNTAAAKALVGDIEEKRGNYAASTRAYESAVGLAPDQESYSVAFALHLIRHQDFAKAIATLQRSMQQFPKSGKLRALLGIAYYAMGETQDAISALEASIAVEPNLDATYHSLAQIVLQSAAVPTSKVTADLCFWDQFVCAALQLRTAHADQDGPSEIKAIAKLQQAPPANVMAHCELARGYEWTSRLPEARIQMEECVRYEPSPQNHYRLGLIYQKSGMTEDAKKELELRSRQIQQMSEQTSAGLDALRVYSSQPK